MKQISSLLCLRETEPFTRTENLDNPEALPAVNRLNYRVISFILEIFNTVLNITQ